MVQYSRSLVTAKAKQCFPDEDQEQVLAILDLYDDREGERMKIAILKLSKGQLEGLHHYVQAAKDDYRDVLAWAEYPEEMRTWNVKDQEEVNRIRERDRKQYLDWLDTEGIA